MVDEGAGQPRFLAFQLVVQQVDEQLEVLVLQLLTSVDEDVHDVFWVQVFEDWLALVSVGEFAVDDLCEDGVVLLAAAHVEDLDQGAVI